MTKKLTTLFGAAAALLLAASPAAVPAQRIGTQTAIDFAGGGGIRDWHAEDEQSIYIMDRMGRWYHATFSHRCARLPNSGTVHFETDALGRFDHFSQVHTSWGTCQVDRIVRSHAPAAKGGKRRG
jgi:hypothetical protein